MATVVLTAVGTALGGPIGGAIGAVIGQVIDQNILFKPKGRQGPRLNELAVQTSSYGSGIPRLFGTTRVAGTVIWATDLVERRSKSGGGKGRPSTTTFSYSASFAVLLSARQVKRIGRIWADGDLLRGAAGDFKVETGFRFYPGDERQAVDPLIASAEGIVNTPAYRGGAYAVFQDFQLGDFGNRIPSLTFEVVADDGPVPVSAIVETLSDGAVLGGPARAFIGFAASGDSVRGVIETIGQALPLPLVDDGAVLRVAGTEVPVVELALAERDAGVGGGDRDGAQFQSALAIPAEIGIAYYEPARDYQTGLQRARRPGPGRRDDRIDLPAVMAAADAKAIAEAKIASLWTERARRTVRAGWQRMGLRAGERVTIAGEAGVWRIAGMTLDRMMVELALVRARATSALPAPDAEPGRNTGGVDQVHGPTMVHLIDLPSLTDEPARVPRLFVAAAGASAGWRRASLLASLDDGASWEPIGGTAPAATMGVVESVPGVAGAGLLDLANVVEVALLNDTMLLTDADDARLIGGANLALVGDELVQFGRAVPLGDNRWRLERLVRGRRGTEWAIAAHSVGERFVLIEADTLAPYDPPLSTVGGNARIMAVGVGDIAAPAEDMATAIGEAVRPPSPVALTAVWQVDGSLAIGWTRRSRSGWRWSDFVDAPIGEERESYRVTITADGGAAVEIDVETPGLVYALAGGPASVSVAVVQRGTFAASHPVAIMISAN